MKFVKAIYQACGISFVALLSMAAGAGAHSSSETIGHLDERVAEIPTGIPAQSAGGRSDSGSAASQRGLVGKIEEDQAMVTDPLTGNTLSVDYGGAPKISIQDGSGTTLFSIKSRGRIFTDFVSTNGDRLDPTASLGGIPLSPAPASYPASGVGVDALRFGIEGVMFRSLEYRLEADFADNELNVTDAFLRYGSDLLPAEVTFGQFKHPTSLAEQTSSRFITFAERPMFTDAFAFGRRLGVGMSKAAGRFSLSAGVFGDTINGDNGRDNLLVAARGVYAPINTYGSQAVDLQDHRLLHFGLSGFYRRMGDDNPAYNFFDGDIVGPSPDIFGTRNFRGDSDTFIGAELAYVNGPFSVQGEYGIDFVRSDGEILGRGPSGTADNPAFHGGYVETSYFISGNAIRGYKDGSFDRPIFAKGVLPSQGGYGAVELAGRIDYLDLNDGNLQGGEIYTFGLGVNWWTTPYSRLMFNYFRTNVSNAADIAFDGGLPYDNKVNSFLVRAQVDF